MNTGQVPASDNLDHKLIEAVESGDAVEMTPEDWARIKAIVRARLVGRAQGKNHGKGSKLYGEDTDGNYSS